MSLTTINLAEALNYINKMNMNESSSEIKFSSDIVCSVDDLMNLNNKIKSLQEEVDKLTKELKDQKHYTETYRVSSSKHEKEISSIHDVLNLMGVDRVSKPVSQYDYEKEIPLSMRFVLLMNGLRKGTL